MLGALILSILGNLLSPVVQRFLEDTWGQDEYPSLFAFMYWSGLTLGSLGIFLLHNVVGGKWGVVIRKFVESGTRTLPLIALLLIPIFFGMKSLYIWTDPAVRAHDFAVGHKNGYMNVPMFIGRAALYFAIWFFWGYRLLAWSKQRWTRRPACCRCTRPGCSSAPSPG